MVNGHKQTKMNSDNIYENRNRWYMYVYINVYFDIYELIYENIYPYIYMPIYVFTSLFSYIRI
jgi:hypothetical protein